MKTLSQVGLSQASAESYYREDEDDCKANRELASRGVGAGGSVPLAPNLWQKWVPSGLCKRYQEWESDRLPKIIEGRWR